MSPRTDAVSQHFTSKAIRGNAAWDTVAADESFADVDRAPRGQACFWGLPFFMGKRPVLLREGGQPVTVKLPQTRARWLVLAHVSGRQEMTPDSRRHGPGRLAEHAANYSLIYADGSERQMAIRRRHHLGCHTRGWGENCTEAVAHGSPRPIQPDRDGQAWGHSQTRATASDSFAFTFWLWAWENPQPKKTVVGMRFEAVSGSVVVAGMSSGNTRSNPLRWRSRRKGILRLPRGVEFDFDMDGRGEFTGLRLDLGQVISAEPRWAYPDKDWDKTYNNALPARVERDVLVEYTSHEEAAFHVPGRRPVAVAAAEKGGQSGGPLSPIRPAGQTVRLRVVDKATGQPVAVKLHVHGAAGEYLPPSNLHRLPNSHWFEDYSPEFQHQGVHKCVYIDGETELRVPLGAVYLEVSKGFEIRPVRRRFRITRATTDLTIELEKVLRWRESGWVSADTHVHFLSPQTGLLEGAGEGVNVVNLLASQWGELMTNTGDFDGRTTFGTRERVAATASTSCALERRIVSTSWDTFPWSATTVR